MKRPVILLAGLLTVVNCGEGRLPTGPSSTPDNEWVTSQNSGFTYRYTAADQAAVDRIMAIVPASAGRVTTFLGLPYVSPLEVVVYPNRAQFTAKLNEVWNVPAASVECWAIGMAGRSGIYLLTPRVWGTEACGHADSTESLTGVVAHELVHALHIQQQRAQRPDEALFMTARWMIEGLGVYASGQIEREYASPARARFAAGFAPQTFLDLYDDPAFYSLAGHLVGYIDAKYGRAMVRALMTARTSADALAALGTTEEALLRSWREHMTA